MYILNKNIVIPLYSRLVHYGVYTVEPKKNIKNKDILFVAFTDSENMGRFTFEDTYWDSFLFVDPKKMNNLRYLQKVYTEYEDTTAPLIQAALAVMESSSPEHEKEQSQRLLDSFSAVKATLLNRINSAAKSSEEKKYK